MKTCLYTVLTVLGVLLCSSAGLAQSCVVFFSLDELDYTGVDATSAATYPDFNTRLVADYIAAKTGSISCRIRPSVPYPKRMNEAIALYQEQLAEEKLPALPDEQFDAEACTVLYLGYPVWLNSLPLEVLSWLQTHAQKLEGKEIRIFTTTGSSPQQGSLARIQQLFPSLKLAPASLNLKTAERNHYQELVDRWLQNP